jgi:hypothetical protein
MQESNTLTSIYLETGQKRVFAGALDWPGWCRSGRDEQAALQALLAYGPRYADAIRPAFPDFQVPARLEDFIVVERLEGNPTTDFGAPDAVPAADALPVGDADLLRFQALLRACWRKLDETVTAAAGKELRKGPRGGGREAVEIVLHVSGSEEGYLKALGWKPDPGIANDPGRTSQAVLEGLAGTAQREGPVRGPRGGLRWTPRYFVRRVAWHILDHAWEIEDRIIIIKEE